MTSLIGGLIIPSGMKRRQSADVLHLIPAMLFLVLAGVFSTSYTAVIFEPYFLFPILNTVLLSALSFSVAFIAARSFTRQSSPVFILFGCGMVAFGMGSLMAGWGLQPYGQNFVVTIHNTGCLVGGLCHVSGILMLVRGIPAKSQSQRRSAAFLCAMAYSAVALLLLAISLLTIKGFVPAFFIKNQGPTPIRQVVLTFAAISFALSAGLLIEHYYQTGVRFFALYSNGLLLMAIGLGILLFNRNVGSLMSWSGRAMQYAGGAYIFAALLAGQRQTRRLGFSLPAYLNELFRLQVNDEVRIRTRELVAMNEKLSHEMLERELAERELHRSEERLRLAAEAAGFGIYNFNFETGETYYSREFLELFGLASKAPLSLDDDLVAWAVHPDDHEVFRSQMNAANDPHGPGILDIEYRIVRADGEVRWLRVRGRTIFRDSGREARPSQASGIVQDVTTRRLAGAALRESEQRFRSLIEKAPVAIGIAREGRMVYGNDAYARLFGIQTFEQVSGLLEVDHVAPQFREEVSERSMRRARGEPTEDEYEMMALRLDGRQFPCRVAASRLAFPEGPATLAFLFDLSEQKEARKKLEDSHSKLRSLAVHLLHAREEERKTVAREIHDELGQILTAMKMDLQWIEKRLAPGTTQIMEKVHGVVGLADQTIQLVHRISSELRPGMLDDLGLAAAIEWFAGDFSRRNGIPCRADITVPRSRFGGNSSTAVFRIVQEALTNVARHAHASHVSVEIWEADLTLTIRVQDDGEGVTEEQSTSPSSFGLTGIRERVQGLHGEMQIVGTPGKGTTLTATIPLPPQGALA